MRDKIAIIQAELEANNWLATKPSFRTTSSGTNTFVNEAYCELCGCHPEEIAKLGWRYFAYDDHQADDYYEKWRLAADSLSQFSSKLKIQNLKGEYRGEWLIRIRPLGPLEINGVKDYLWHGILYPFDAEAFKISAEHEGLSYQP